MVRRNQGRKYDDAILWEEDNTNHIIMTGEELLASIEVYQNQLQQIEEALTTAGNEEKRQLKELQANLLQLLELTLQQLNQQSHSEPQKDTAHGNQEQPAKDITPSNSKSEEINLDEEFALFKSEIAAISGEDEEDKTTAKHSQEELEAMVGNHFRAPFTEKWGGLSYHNAVILSLVTKEGGDVSLVDPEVRVLFSQPTSLEMLTCRFFLSGYCKYSEDKCRFSHGKVVPVAEIKEYRDPDYDALVPGSRVLVQYSNDLWTNATIQDILEDRSAFCIKYDKNKEIAEVTPLQLVPLGHDDGVENDSEDDNDAERSGPTQDTSLDSSDDEQEIFIPSANWFQNSLSRRLGDWEKHTKGIGSKLMEKMGYIVGTGLGREGEGRVEPVSAYVYPQGVSLDRCMELREASNGEELLEVEKRLDREKRKEEAKSAQVAERLRKQTSVFDIINKKLGGKGQPSEDDVDEKEKPKVNISSGVLQKDTAKNLNRKNYQISENIRQLEREVNKIEKTKERQSNNKAALALINTRLEAKKSELRKFKDAEKLVQGEQQKRRDTKKFCIF